MGLVLKNDIKCCFLKQSKVLQCPIAYYVHTSNLKLFKSTQYDNICCKL